VAVVAVVSAVVVVVVVVVGQAPSVSPWFAIWAGTEGAPTVIVTNGFFFECVW
jgi:hypothetical protein